MTVHASKGLEFPVVFLVNMARGATGFPRPIKVIAAGDGDEPSVSVAPFVSEMDELEREREQHETRRLLYVATTRARDRLYFSSALKDGSLRPGPGSLADVLPPSLKPLFAAAALTADETVPWRSASGRTFTWRVCRPPAATVDVGAPRLESEILPSLPALAPSSRTVPRLSVTEWLERNLPGEHHSGGSSPDAVLIGILVHRLFQAASRRLTANADVTALAASLLRPEERAACPDVQSVAEQAAAIWNTVAGRDEVVSLLGSVDVMAEVPFSLQINDAGRRAVLRGTMDGVAIAEDGRVTVVEFKTGQRRAVHQAQLDLYVRAARELFPGRPVEGLLIYQGGS
jgi:ATP-dependent helicase/nuclease subunit A